MRLADSKAPEVAEDEPGVGSLIGSYRLVRRVGAGGMGVVFEALHERIGQRAALKVMERGRRDGISEQALRRFLTEARALSRVEHPGLVRIFDCGETPAGVPWLVMEYLDGESLRARLERFTREGRRMPLDEAMRAARQIASAAAATYRARIVHRDLKPENIMVVADDEAPGGERVKLLDFGIAKLLDTDAALTTDGVVLGTAAYMAPEQCTGRSEVDGYADVYALGVILYELVAAERPFHGDATSVMRQHLFVDPPPLEGRVPDLPAALSTLIARMLAKEPSLRPTMEVVVERLRELDPAAVSARRLPAPGAAAVGPGEMSPRDDASAPNEAAITAPGELTLDKPPMTRPAAEAARAEITAVIDPSREPVLSSPASVVPAPANSGAAEPSERPASSRPRRLIPALVVAAVALGGGTIMFQALRPGRSAGAMMALPGMVQLAGGRFRMGSSPEEIDAACATLPGGCVEEEMPQLQREKPAREVTVSPFQIDVNEVTNREYAAFLNAVAAQLEVREDSDEHFPRFVVEHASGLTLADLHPAVGGIDRAADGRFTVRAGRERRPVVQITWEGASRHCRHLGKRLPTEAEWEIAARGVAGRRFPWGAEPPRCDGVVFGRGEARGCPDLRPEIEIVGTAPQDVTPEGVHDLGGNVGEWVQDQFVLPYYGSCGDCSDPVAEQPVPITDDVRIFRGGTFRGVAWFSRATTRSRWKRTDVMDGVGFRCVSR